MEAVIVFDVVQALMRKLPEVFLGVEVVYSFGEGRPVIGDWSTSGNEGLLINRDGVGSKSGVYFFYAERVVRLYILVRLQNIICTTEFGIMSEHRRGLKMDGLNSRMGN